MNSFEIRNASSSDVCALTRMLETLGYPTNEHTLAERLSRFTSQSGYGVAVAISDDNLIGFVAWSKSLLFVSSAVRIHIEGIFIDQKYRGFGIGKKLMQHVEEIAALSTFSSSPSKHSGPENGSLSEIECENAVGKIESDGRKITGLKDKAEIAKSYSI